MRLKNKKTGETGYYLHTHREHKTGVLKVAVLKDGVPFSEFKPHEPIYDYDSLAELNEEWEDVPEELKEYWIPMSDEPYPFVGNDWEKEGLATGLISLSKEENDRKRQKLKAWTRLKDKGFRFSKQISKFDEGKDKWHFLISAYCKELDENTETDLDLLFGGEE